MDPRPGKLYKADCLYCWSYGDNKKCSVEPDDVVMVTHVRSVKQVGMFGLGTSRFVSFLHVRWDSTEAKELELPRGVFMKYFTEAQRFK